MLVSLKLVGEKIIDIHQKNIKRSEKAEEMASQLIDRASMSIDDNLDAEIKNFIQHCSLAKKQFMDQRMPFTKQLDDVKKEFIFIEKKLDVNNKNSLIHSLQEIRNNYAKKKLERQREEQRRRQEEIRNREEEVRKKEEELQKCKNVDEEKKDEIYHQKSEILLQKIENSIDDQPIAKTKLKLRVKNHIGYSEIIAFWCSKFLESYEEKSLLNKKVSSMIIDINNLANKSNVYIESKNVDYVEEVKSV